MNNESSKEETLKRALQRALQLLLIPANKWTQSHQDEYEALRQIAGPII